MRALQFIADGMKCHEHAKSSSCQIPWSRFFKPILSACVPSSSPNINKRTKPWQRQASFQPQSRCAASIADNDCWSIATILIYQEKFAILPRVSSRRTNIRILVSFLSLLIVFLCFLFYERRTTPRARPPSKRVEWRRLKHSSR